MTAALVRGAGTGLSDGAVATDGAFVLDVTRMNRIVEVLAPRAVCDAAGLDATVPRNADIPVSRTNHV